MEILSLDHNALLVHDVEHSLDFYRTVLGMVEVERPPTFHFPSAWLRKGRAEIHLIGEAEQGRAATLQPSYYERELRRGYLPHFALEVTDLAAAQRHLAALGVAVVGGPQPRGDGVLQIYIRDPDGYIIELFQRDAA